MNLLSGRKLRGEIDVLRAEGGDERVHGRLPSLVREDFRAGERARKQRRARVFRDLRDEEIRDIEERMDLRGESECRRVLGLRKLGRFLCELWICQQRGMACAADLPAAAVVEAEELWPGTEAANPVEGVNPEDLLEVALDVIPPPAYELEDSSDFPGASSTLRPKR
ncbi:hypothetical protein ACWCW7_35140 [Nocardia tengchongensis]